MPDAGPGDMNSEEFRVARNETIDARTACGGPATGCEQDGENFPGAFGTDSVACSWIDHGPTCPARQPGAAVTTPHR